MKVTWYDKVKNVLDNIYNRDKTGFLVPGSLISFSRGQEHSTKHALPRVTDILFEVSSPHAVKIMDI